MPMFADPISCASAARRSKTNFGRRSGVPPYSSSRVLMFEDKNCSGTGDRRVRIPHGLGK